MAGATTQTSESFEVWANPMSLTLGAGGIVPPPPPIFLFTATPSETITSTFVCSPTYTVTPSCTATPSATPTATPSDTPPTPGSTLTWTPTISATSTTSPTADNTASASPTFTETLTYSDTLTVSPSSTPTLSFSTTMSFTPVPAGSTSTVTPTPTGTPGSGSYAYSLRNGFGQRILPPPYLVVGSTGNELFVSYTAAVQFEYGMVVFQIPPDLGAPAADNCSVVPAEQLNVDSITYSGQCVSVTVDSLYPGQVLVLQYDPVNNNGFALGFLFPTQNPTPPVSSSESVAVWENPQAGTVNFEGVGLVPPPSPIAILTSTVTWTFSPSPTITLTPTLTVSATLTPSPTISPTFTKTPVGAAPETGFYTYPNPFDKHQQSFVTIRFPNNTDSASITIFNLLGNPVREIPASDIQAASGVAIWTGEDDYGRQVPGGLYFVRLKTPSGVTVHKMTVFQ